MHGILEGFGILFEPCQTAVQDEGQEQIYVILFTNRLTY